MEFRAHLSQFSFVPSSSTSSAPKWTFSVARGGSGTRGSAGAGMGASGAKSPLTSQNEDLERQRSSLLVTDIDGEVVSVAESPTCTRQRTLPLPNLSSKSEETFSPYGKGRLALDLDTSGNELPPSSSSLFSIDRPVRSHYSQPQLLSSASKDSLLRLQGFRFGNIESMNNDNEIQDKSSDAGIHSNRKSEKSILHEESSSTAKKKNSSSAASIRPSRKRMVVSSSESESEEIITPQSPGQYLNDSDTAANLKTDDSNIDNLKAVGTVANPHTLSSPILSSTKRRRISANRKKSGVLALSDESGEDERFNDTTEGIVMDEDEANMDMYSRNALPSSSSSSVSSVLSSASSTSLPSSSSSSSSSSSYFSQSDRRTRRLQRRQQRNSDDDSEEAAANTDANSDPQMRYSLSTLHFFHSANARLLCSMAKIPYELAEKFVLFRDTPPEKRAAVFSAQGIKGALDSNSSYSNGHSSSPADYSQRQKLQNEILLCLNAAKIRRDCITQFDQTLSGSDVNGLLRRCEIIAEMMREPALDVNVHSSFNSSSTTTSGAAATIIHKEDAYDFLGGKLRLKSYQHAGIAWLKALWERGLSGILADEMGLGKTAQVISFLGLLKRFGENGPHLVIVPSSIIDNWTREFTKWVPSLKVQVYYGSQSERSFQREDIRKNRASTNVVVTTYNTTAMQKEDRAFLRRMKFVYLIADEGHMVKNMSSQRYTHLSSIPAQYRLLLTGTPVQNNLTELLSLIDFTMPALIDKDCRDEVLALFRKMIVHDTSNSDSSNLVEHAARILAPFVLRRRKCNVITDLPTKHETQHICRMTPSQEQQYAELTRRAKETLTESTLVHGSATVSSKSKSNSASSLSRLGIGRKKGDELEDNSSAAYILSTSSSNGKSAQMGNILMQLRKMAIHPLLFRRLYDEAKLREISRKITSEIEYVESDPELVFEDLCFLSDYEIHRLCCKNKSIQKMKLSDQALFDAGKIVELKKMLENYFEKGDRVLLFSQFVISLDILEEIMEIWGYRYLRMDGRTPVNERQLLIDRFNENEDNFIFLLSTKAGGFGINLVGANVVVIFDSDFNPHNDRQAEDRAHRVGQTRDVTVVKMIMHGTVEERIHNRAQLKLKLDQDIASVSEVVDAEDTDVPKAKKSQPAPDLSEFELSRFLRDELFNVPDSNAETSISALKE